MLGDHVIPVLLLGSWAGPRSHLDSRCRGVGPIHFPDCLVRNLTCVPSLAYSCREFCLRHPEVRDVCDLGQMLFYGWKWVWYATAVMFILNNTFIQVGNPHCYINIPDIESLRVSMSWSAPST